MRGSSADTVGRPLGKGLAGAFGPASHLTDGGVDGPLKADGRQPARCALKPSGLNPVGGRLLRRSSCNQRGDQHAHGWKVTMAGSEVMIPPPSSRA